MSMTRVQELITDSYVPGLEGLGGYHYEFCPDQYTKLLVQEFVDWAKPMLGMGECDEASLREHLGIS